MANDHDRRELFDVLEAGLGTRGAALLMAQLPPVAWDELATKSDLALLRGEMEYRFGQIEARFGQIDGRFGQIDGRLGGLVPKLWAANVATMIGLAGLVFAVASFAR